MGDLWLRPDLLFQGGMACAYPSSKYQDNAIFFHAQNGDIVIKASNGKIRMEADSIEMVCNGTKPKGEGHFWLTANNDIEIKGTDILVESKSTLKLVSSGVAGLKGKPIEIIGSLITGVSKATNRISSFKSG